MGILTSFQRTHSEERRAGIEKLNGMAATEKRPPLTFMTRQGKFFLGSYSACGSALDTFVVVWRGHREHREASSQAENCTGGRYDTHVVFSASLRPRLSVIILRSWTNTSASVWDVIRLASQGVQRKAVL